MTISTEVRKAGPFNGNGTASVFSFAFKVFKAQDLIVVRRQNDISTESTLVLNSDYSVALNANQDSSPGGTVTLLAGPLAAGFTLVVTSDLPYLQPTDLTNQGGFYPKVVTNALDRLTIFCQQLRELVDRSLKLPLTAPNGISTELPFPSPNDLIGWDEQGQGLTNISPQSLVTSIAYGSATADLFAGDGVTTTFPLTLNPASVNNLDVSIGGYSQRPVQGAVGDYSWDGGASITFVTPPPAPAVPGDKNILVRYMQAIPVSDSETLHAQSREALRRTYADAGYNLVAGSFETGGTLVNANDVLLHEASGKAFSGPAGAVPAGTNPASSGFVDRSPSLADSGSVTFLGTTVEEKLKSASTQVSDYGTLAQVPLTQVNTIDSMGESTDEVLVKATTTAPLQQCSIRDVGITAVGTPAGGAAGAVNYYAFIRTGKAGAHIAFNAFNGNGKGTFSAYRPAAINEWMLPFVLAGDRQKAIGNDSIDSCGHAIENTSGATKSLIVALNTAKRHNGLGITNVVGYANLGNVSDETSDSHITSNSNNNAVISSNVGHSAIAASGCDLAGGTNVVAVGSVFSNNQFSGIWALKSPNTGATLNNVNISSHVLSGNTKYPGATNGQGELTLGDYNNKTDYQGKAWFAHGNLVDVSSGTNFSLAAWVHKFISAPSVSYNYITGVDKPADAIQVLDEGAEYASYVGNIGRSVNVTGDYVYSTIYLRTKVSGRGATYANNDGFRIDPQSLVMPEVMHDEDGNWRYSCVKQSAASNYVLARFVNDGAITPYLIKLTLCKRGTSFGFLEKVLCIQGNSSAGTVVVSNVDSTSAGSPIGVSVDVSNTGYSQLVIGAHADAMSIKLEVVSPASDRNHILMFP